MAPGSSRFFKECTGQTTDGNEVAQGEEEKEEEEKEEEDEEDDDDNKLKHVGPREN